MYQCLDLCSFCVLTYCYLAQRRRHSVARLRCSICECFMTVGVATCPWLPLFHNATCRLIQGGCRPRVHHFRLNGTAFRRCLHTSPPCHPTRVGFGLVHWGLTPQQQPGSYQGGEMMMMKSVISFLVEETGVPGGNHRPTADTHILLKTALGNCIVEYCGGKIVHSNVCR